MCFEELLSEYTHQGKMMIELGLAFVFGWSLLYILLAVAPFKLPLSPTAPFLAFGVLCVFLGLTQKKAKRNRSRKAEEIGGMEELGLAVLGLEFIAALLIIIFVGGYAFSKPNGGLFIASLLFSIALSAAAFYVYWLKYSEKVCCFRFYDNLLLLIAILSHTFWTSLLSSVV